MRILLGDRRTKAALLCFGTTSLRLYYCVLPRRPALSPPCIRIELIRPVVAGCSKLPKPSNHFLTPICGHQALKRVENGWNEVVNACLKRIDKTPIAAAPFCRCDQSLEIPHVCSWMP